MTVQCEKCKQFVPEEQTRTFNLTLRPDNLRKQTTNIDRIVICLNCESKRRTTITRYVSL